MASVNLSIVSLCEEDVTIISLVIMHLVPGFYVCLVNMVYNGVHEWRSPSHMIAHDRTRS